MKDGASLLRKPPGGHDITCRQAVTLIPEYLDGAVVRDDRDRLEAHVDICENCTEHLKQVSVTIAASSRLRDNDLHPVAREGLLQLYRRWRDGIE